MLGRHPLPMAWGFPYFMVNFSHLLLTHFRQAVPEFGLLDLKAHFRARRYARETLKLFPEGQYLRHFHFS